MQNHWVSKEKNTQKRFTERELSEINAADMLYLLQKIGCKLLSKSGKDFCFENPLRSERTSSFFVSFSGGVWLWHDFGTGKGGNIIQFWQEYTQKDFVKCVYELKNIFFSFSHPDIMPKTVWSEADEMPKTEVLEVKNLQNKALIYYLCSQRKIPYALARQYVREIYFRMPQKSGERVYFGLAFPNDAGGYEVRNPYMKLCIAPKSVSTFEADASQLCIFEGFTDFLAAMAYYKTDKPKYKTIVLNSLSFLTEDFLKAQAAVAYTRLHSFTDNDTQGIAANEKLRSITPALVHHTARVFTEAKDWAEGWVRRIKPLE